MCVRVGALLALLGPVPLAPRERAGAKEVDSDMVG